MQANCKKSKPSTLQTSRFKAKDVPGSVLKNAPDFCTVYVIHKGKISSTRASSRPPPSSQLRNQILLQASIKYNNTMEQNSLQSTTSSRSQFLYWSNIMFLVFYTSNSSSVFDAFCAGSFSANSRQSEASPPRTSRLSDANFKYDIICFQIHNAYYLLTAIDHNTKVGDQKASSCHDGILTLNKKAK